MKSLFLSRPANMAHRGARSLAPENTLASARKGYECGADSWELDVAVTRDGELVILHDGSPARTSNVAEVFPGREHDPVHTFTFAELRQLDFGSWFNQVDPFQQIAAGAVTAEMQHSYIGEPIPTLKDALTFTRDHDWQVNIEIKNAANTPGDRFVVEAVVEMVEALDMVRSVLISSFNLSYLPRVKEANERIATAAIVERPIPDPVALVHGLGAIGYNPGGRALFPEQIPLLRQAGIAVTVWTINDAETMRLMLESKPSAICTDFPQLLAQVLAEK